MARVISPCLALLACGLMATPAPADIASTALEVPGSRAVPLVDVAAEPLGSALVAWYDPASKAVRVAERKGSRWRTAGIALEPAPVGLSAWYATDGPGVAYADAEGVWITRRSNGWRPALLVAGDAVALDAAVLADGSLLVVAAMREGGTARLLAFAGALGAAPTQRDLGAVPDTTPVAAERYRAGSAIGYAGVAGGLVVATDDGGRRRVHRLGTRAGDVRLAADASGSVAAVYAGLPAGTGTRAIVGVARFGAHGGAPRPIERDLACPGRPRPVVIGFLATELRVGYLACTGVWRLARSDGRPASVTPAGRLVGVLRASATIAGRIVLVGERGGRLELQWLRP